MNNWRDINAPHTLHDARAVAAQNDFILGVYRWMALGLLCTAGVATLVAGTPAAVEFIFGNKIVFYLLLFAPVGMVIYLSARLHALSPAAARGWFLAYAAVNGVMFSSLFLVYRLGTVGSVFVVTAAMFGTMTVVGHVTKRDLTNFGSFLMMGLVGMVIASLVNLFFHNETVHWLVTYLGVFIFLGLTVYDTKKLKDMSYTVSAQGGDVAARVGIMGALALYLDFINLFLLLLRIFGGDRRR